MPVREFNDGHKECNFYDVEFNDGEFYDGEFNDGHVPPCRCVNSYIPGAKRSGQLYESEGVRSSSSQRLHFGRHLDR